LEVAAASYLGIDIGTSSVKVVVVDERGGIRDTQESPLVVSRPSPLWSEQDPEDWWCATQEAVTAIVARGGVKSVRAIGLSGQMHGATVLGADDRPIRPAILWNDGRSADACRTLEARVEHSREITGNLAMPGFTAPKLVWMAEHEPDLFARVRRVLLPKDYVRFRMTGEYATDYSDASGTLWLDVGKRSWSDSMLEGTGLDESAMPRLCEGTEESGVLSPEVARDWGMESVPVAGGGSDQAAGAVGSGVVAPGNASLSLGTSGVLFVADDRFRPNPERAMHAFCHALPDRWHEMSVILSAASCLAWVSELVGASNPAALVAEVEARDQVDSRLLFLPYLSGERTPHNDVEATGTFLGLRHDVDRVALGRAVMEGVAFAFADGLEVLLESGAEIGDISVIGGGSRSGLWGRILASVLDRPLSYHQGAEVGPALGAARLAQIMESGADVSEVCAKSPLVETAEPDATLVEKYRPMLERYRATYPALQRSTAS
jgi:xylulokinase